MRKLIILFFVVAHSAAAGTLKAAAVRTESGLISGAGGDVRVYKGVPYASPPVGSLRWQQPARAPHWQGVRAATEFGAGCPQAFSGAKLPRLSEDCLTLNIWTPSRKPGVKLAVMVSIHGGGFVGGWSGIDAYDGTALARQGVVVVSMNYRLGVLGFLAHPALTNESSHRASGNYGLMDQIAALEWIQRNIAAFGGDPKRVTIFGESAGGSSVCYLLVSPPAKGLFQRAISQSAQGIFLPMTSAAQAAKRGAQQLGDDLAALRALRWEDLMKKVQTGGAGMPAGVQFQPIVDGWVLPEDPALMFDAGRAHAVPVIAGTNTDDGAALMLFQPVRTLSAYRDYLKTRFGDAADRAMELYPATSDLEGRKAARQMATDANFLLGARSVLLAMARSGRAYWYQFTRVDPASRKMGALGAMHGAEVGYVFGDVTKSLFAGTPLLPGGVEGFDDTDRALAKAMSGAWVRFAETGDPNGPGLPRWPAVDALAPEYLEFGDRIQTGRAFREEQMQFLAERLKPRPPGRY